MPIRQETVKISREYNGKVKEWEQQVNVYDVSRLIDSRRPRFDNESEAIDWMMKEVDDSCVDNERFAYEDDPEAMKKYEEAKHDGCCGSFDVDIIVAGRPAKIGCNYGH